MKVYYYRSNVLNNKGGEIAIMGKSKTHIKSILKGYDFSKDIEIYERCNNNSIDYAEEKILSQAQLIKEGLIIGAIRIRLKGGGYYDFTRLL